MDNPYILSLFVIIFSTMACLTVEWNLSINAGWTVRQEPNFSTFVELCRRHNLELTLKRRPGYDGDNADCLFEFRGENVAKVLRPRPCLKVLRLLESGNVERAFRLLMRT